jgi:hypothetical protein
MFRRRGAEESENSENRPASVYSIRWVRGFHAALYREHLPIDAPKHIQPPMTPAAQGKLGIVPEKPLDHQPEMVEIIQRNRGLGCRDRVVTGAGRCIYECVWFDFDDPGPHGCAFAIQLYDWSSLGETRRTGRRGCVGYYASARIPEGASVEIRDPNRRVTGNLDPFAEDAVGAGPSARDNT